MFAPLIAAAVALPLVATVALAVSVWHLATHEPSFASADHLREPLALAARLRDARRGHASAV